MKNLSAQSVNRLFQIGAGIFVLLAIIGVIRGYSPVPFWDEWDGFLGFYLRLQQGDWAAWWAQHNEHRIVLARAIYWFDVVLFQDRGIFLLVSNFVFLSVIAFVFLRIWQERGAGQFPWVGAFLTAWLFSWIQETNFSLGFQSQFLLAQLLPLTALYLLHRSSQDPRKFLLFSFSLLLGLLSVGSMANGVLAIPLLFVFAVLARMGWQRILTLGALAIIVTWFYYLDYMPIDYHGSLIESLQQSPIDVAHFVLLYLGAPFYYFFGKGDVSQGIALLAGIIFVGSTVVFAIKILPVGHEKTLELMLLMFLAFVGVGSLGTAGGRVIFGVDAALSSRYMTPVLMGWAALLILYLPYLEQLGWRARGRIWIPFALMLVLMLFQQVGAFDSKSTQNFEREVAALALELEIKDLDQIKRVYPFVESWLWTPQGARKLDLSIFGATSIRDTNELIGTQKVPTSADPLLCSALIEETVVLEEDPRFLRISGWFDVPDRSFVTQPIVLRGVDNVVEGVVVLGPKRNVRLADNGGEIRLPKIKGYMRSTFEGESVQIGGLRNGCQAFAGIPKK